MKGFLKVEQVKVNTQNLIIQHQESMKESNSLSAIALGTQRLTSSANDQDNSSKEQNNTMENLES